MRHVYRLSHTNCVKNESTEAVQLMFTKNKWQDGDREWKCMRKFQCNCQHFTNVFKYQQPQQQHNSFFKRYANGRTSVIRDWHKEKGVMNWFQDQCTPQFHNSAVQQVDSIEGSFNFMFKVGRGELQAIKIIRLSTAHVSIWSIKHSPSFQKCRRRGWALLRRNRRWRRRKMKTSVEMCESSTSNPWRALGKNTSKWGWLIQQHLNGGNTWRCQSREAHTASHFNA